MGSIAEAVAAVEQRICMACKGARRSRDSVRLTAVTKTQEPRVLAELRACGVGDFGENRVDHLEQMLEHRATSDRFHFIGRVQSRQFAKIVPHIASLHSLADPRHVPKLGRICAEHQRRLPVFIQVNTSGEAQKAGVAPDDLSAFCDAVHAEEHLQAIGLMCMAPDLRGGKQDSSWVQRSFALLRKLADAQGLARLSMGMSGDFEIAIAEGATDIRVGSVLFP